MTRHVLAVDQGTSGTKAAVVDEAGTIVGIAEVALRPRYGADGAVEQDPELLFASIIEAGCAAIAAAGVPVHAVALANQGETVLAWDRDTGRPLTPAVVWQDRRSASICDELASHADQIRAVTGLTLDPYFSAPKMAWVRRHLTTAGVVTTTDTWIVHRLCGAFVTDTTTASRSLLMDLESRAWSDEMVALFGLEGEPMPTIVASDVQVGTTDLFGDTIPVTGLIVDQQAALLAESCLDVADAKCTFGTGAFLLAQTGPSAVVAPDGLARSVAWDLRGRTSYCLDGQVYTAASTIAWLADLGIIGGAAELDEIASDDSGGAIFVPAFAGLGAPWWQPGARASLTGLSLSTGRPEIVRAMLDGIAAQVAMLIATMDKSLGSPIASLRVDGGLTRSRALMQAQADLSQIPVEVFPSQHATVLGAAACARLGLDPALTVPQATTGWRPSAQFTPRWSADRAATYLDTFTESMGSGQL